MAGRVVMVDPYLIPIQYPKGRYLLAFDPLDGSSNIDVNVSVGSIFSVLRAPNPGADPDVRDFLQPGSRQVCAGYAIYGPSTMLAQRGNGSACVHPRSGGRRVHPHPGADSNSAPHNRLRDQRLQPTVVGTRGATVCQGLFGRARRPAPQRLQHALGRLTGGRNAPNPDRGGVFLYLRDSRDPAKPGRLCCRGPTRSWTWPIMPGSSSGRDKRMDGIGRPWGITGLAASRSAAGYRRQGRDT